MKSLHILAALLLMPSLVQGEWYDPGWHYRQKITLSSALADSDLIDFPYLVKISDPGHPLFSATQPSGDDILFTGGDGVTRLDHEIEAYDGPGGELVAWVRIDTLRSASDTEIYIYYGNVSVASQENPAGVWDPQHVGVWHLSEVRGGSDNILDSTINGHHGSTHGTPALGAIGQMGPAIVFDGSDYINVPDSPDMGFGLTESFTLSAWINVTDLGTDLRAVVAKGHENSTWYGIWTDGADNYNHYDGDSLVAGPVTEGQWQHVAIVYEAGGATTKRIYLDGVEEGSNSYATAHDGAGDLFFGRPLGLPNDWFEGSLDEVRISNVPRSEPWIRASFRSQDAPESYGSFGPQEAGHVFVVNSTGDAPDSSPGDGYCDTGGTNSEGDPECTLRAAIEEANAWASADSVHFGIPASDPGYSAAPLHWTVRPGSALAAITESAVIDGTTQSGFAGTPVIELDGSLAGLGVTGVTLAGDSSAVRGLAINRFTGSGIRISGARNRVVGNLIGTDVTGTVDRGNVVDGVAVSGNDNTIGGSLPEDRNVISGNDDLGVDIGPGLTGNRIMGNLIGTDISGTAAIGNGLFGWSGGVLLASGPNRLGGAAAGEGNLISGNAPHGVIVYGSVGSVIAGNRIGTDAAGIASIPNTGAGIVIANGSAENRVGGAQAGEPNTLAHNGADGIDVQSSAGSGNAILGNSIFANSGLGVDLGGDGVTANDPGDADIGPNDLLNYPVITQANETGGSVTVDFELDVPAGDYRVEFFTNPSGGDPSGNGEGESFADAVVVNHAGGGAQSYSHSFAGFAGDVVTCAASECTDGGTCSTFGSTSEFSATYTVTGANADLRVSKSVDDPTPGEGDTVNYSVTVANDGPNDASGIEITDLLPAGLTYQSSTPSQGTYESGTGLWTVGGVADGASATLILVATVDAGTAGSTITNTASITAADQPDPDPNNNSASAGITVELRPGYSMLVIASQPESHSLPPGGPLEEIFRIGVYNNTAQAETLTAVTVENTALGPGTQAELDGEWTDLELTIDGPGNPLTATASFAAGSAVLSGFAARVAAGDSLILTIQGAAALTARDADSLDLRINGPGDLEFSRPPLLLAFWPLDPPSRFVVDGLVADQLVIEPVGPATFPIGSADNLALEVIVPPNGYQADELTRLNILNLGTAASGVDVARMRAWVDDGDRVFDPGSDLHLGEFQQTGDRWELTGLAEPVPLAGIRLFVAVDIAEDASQGRTIRLALPSLPDVAFGMASDNDGPIDRATANPYELSISYVDRVAFTAVPVAPATARPGSRDLLLLHLTAVNSYGSAKRVTGLTFTNTTSGAGSQTELDLEIEQLVLRRDGDQNGALNIASDPVIGTSVFDGGVASMSGFVWEIAAGGSGHLFLTGNVSRLSAADGDQLGAMLAEELDIEFEEPSAAAGSWPVDSGARWAVDGMLAHQITNLGAPVATLTGGNGPVLALDLIVPANGYAADVLNAFRVENLGTATGADLAELRLWRDDGDGAFEGPGEDTDLGPMAWLGNGWESSFLAEPLTGVGARLFATLVVAASPADSSTVRLAVPLNGIVTASGNDGPIDEPVVNPHTQLLSQAPLLSTLAIEPPASTVGGTVSVLMRVENAGGEPIDGIVPSSLVEAGSGVLLQASGPDPASFNLAPGASDVFGWTYTAAAVGEVTLAGNASGTASGLPRRSLQSASSPHRVLVEAEELRLFATGTLPPSVNRGETGLVAFNLTFSHAGGPEASDVVVGGLRIRLEDEDASPVVPADAISRVVINEGSSVYLTKTTLETTGSDIDLTLASPLRVTSREPVTVSVTFDISPSTTVPNFRALITGSDVFTAGDATSGAPVAITLEQGTYPVSSGLARLSADATEVRVDAAAGPEVRAQRGGREVPLLDLTLENSGIDLVTSNVRVVSFGLAVTDTSDGLLADPSVYLERIRARVALQELAEIAFSPGDSSRVELVLSPSLSLAVNTPEQLTITADLAGSAPAGAFRLRLLDPVTFRAQDANTGGPVPAIYLSSPLAGPPVLVDLPADSLLVGGDGTLPPVVIIGTTELTAMRIGLHHPGPPGTASVRCDGLSIQVKDQGGTPMVPASVLDRLSVLSGDIEVGVNPDPPAIASNVPLALSDVVLAPGETAELELRIDVKATAPASHLELWIGQAGLGVSDATSGAAILPLPMTGEQLPLTSGLARLMSPPRELVTGLVSRLPRVLALGGDELAVGEIVLANTAAPGSGAITVDRLSLVGGDRNYASVPVGGAATMVRAYAGDSLWAESGPLAVDAAEAELTGAEPLVVEPSSQVEIELRATVREAPSLSSFRLGVNGDGVGVVQPASPLLTIAVEPAAGTFPLWTDAGSFAEATLEASFSNFPNPFAAGRETTSFVYYLREPSTVTIHIWNGRGEHVRTLLNAVERGAGLHQSDQWDGRNGKGRLVMSDVFLAELVVSYGSGESARLLRKVAVLR